MVPITSKSKGVSTVAPRYPVWKISDCQSYLYVEKHDLRKVVLPELRSSNRKLVIVILAINPESGLTTFSIMGTGEDFMFKLSARFAFR